jgi:hypothetical protein
MNSRKAKRHINEADDWVLFTSRTTRDDEYICTYQHGREESWETLLNLAINQYEILETFRNIVNTADEYIRNNKDSE